MTDKRQQLIETAFGLFYQHGIHAVGINQILEHAQVAKKTLYTHFESKEALVDAVLAYRDDRYVSWLQARMEQQAPGKAALLEMFAALDDWINNRVGELSRFNGCFFINICSEYGDPASAQHQYCQRHKQRVRELISEQLAVMEIDGDREYLADMLALLKEGAIVSAQVQGDSEAALKARRLAETLLETD